MKIDVVYLWVDGASPQHLKKRKKYAEKASLETEYNKGLADTRFNQNDELYYSIASVRKFASWVNNIYVITDSQIPDWLDEQKKKELQVIVIDHSDIFKGYESYLPVFNSRSIEAMLGNVPGISDCFIYLNDDFFISGYVQVDDFFSESKPVFRGHYTFRWRPLARFYERYLMKQDFRHGLVGRRAEVKLLNGLRYLQLAHVPHPIVRQDYADLIHNFGIDQIIQYRFRHKKQIWPIGYYANCTLKKSAAVLADRLDWKYIENIDCDELYREDARFLCIQSLDLFDAKEKEEVFSYLKSLVD